MSIHTTAFQTQPMIWHGRGALSNLEGRFSATQRLHFDEDRLSTVILENESQSKPRLPTTVWEQKAKSIISYNDSPDIPFSASLNPYQGCEHGCIYCYARPNHAYHDLSPGIDFETKIMAKINAAEILRQELGRPSYECTPIALGSATDAYQPIEKKYQITRDILKVLSEARHPVGIVTKSALIERDIDILAPMARNNLARVFISVTTLDQDLARNLEPRASAPARRLKIIETLAKAGIPVGVMVAPVIPQINDKDIEKILKAASDAGATRAGYVMLRLPHEVKDLFRQWLLTHYPDRAEHILSLMRQIHDGKVYQSDWGKRMTGNGRFAELIKQRFIIAAARYKMAQKWDALDCKAFVPPRKLSAQLSLF